jgi:hypothetical protein
MLGVEVDCQEGLLQPHDHTGLPSSRLHEIYLDELEDQLEQVLRAHNFNDKILGHRSAPVLPALEGKQGAQPLIGSLRLVLL